MNSVMIDNFVKMFGNEEAANALAKNFAEGMAESAALMCEDDPTSEIPNANVLKAMTIDYAKDMIDDFEISLMKAIEELFSKAKIEVEEKREVKINIKL